MQKTTIGVISDTHGLLRPEAIQALQGVGSIIHGGDIGSIDVFNSLQEIAPVTAIRGNADTGSWALQFPQTLTIDISGHKVYVVHSIKELDFAPETEGYSAVIYGHSHQPSIEKKAGVLYLNPGSCGPAGSGFQSR